MRAEHSLRNFSSLALCFERNIVLKVWSERLTYSLNQWINDKGVCRKASTTPGLFKKIKKNKLANTKYIYLIMFSEAANHFYKAAKQVRSKIMSQLAVMKFTWITLYILKNSHSSQRSEILSILQNPTKSNKNRLAEEEVASPGQSCKQWVFLSEKNQL